MDNLDMIFKKEVVYRIRDMDNVKVIKNITYQSDHGRKSLMDIYTTQNKVPAPVVVLVHGEAKSINNMKEAGQYCSWGRIIAASGMNAVTFNHCVLLDGYSIQDVIQNIDDLLQYVIHNADSLGIDKNRIALWSFSGGVPFGMYVGLSGYFDYIKCILSYYGFGDFHSISQFFSLPLNEGSLRDLSLLKLIQKNAALIPPIFIARAGLDNKLINESINRLIEESLRNNLSIEVVNHAKGQHAFDLFDDNARTHEIINKSINFLKNHLN